MKINSKNDSRGITLIALVITIIVLLILASVSVATITGQNGILSKAEESSSKTSSLSAKEFVSRALLDWQIEKYTKGGNLLNFLQEKVPQEIDGVYQIENDQYEIEKDGYSIIIDSEGNIISEPVKAENRPKISNIKVVKESNGIGENLSKGSVYTENISELYITFEHGIDGGTTTVSPSIPFKVEENGKYNFTITSNLNSELIIKNIIITVNQFSELKIGDYVNYDAGIWSQSEIDELEGEGLYSGENLPTNVNKYQFGGFKLGDNKNISYLNSQGKSGWKVLGFDNETSAIELIHAGTPERILSSK